VCLFLLLFSAVPARADYKDDIGLTALQSEIGAGAPTGAGVTLSQVEALDSGSYAPDPNHGELAGKTFTLKSGASGASGHATSVARNAYGLTNGVAPGITDIDVYEAGNYYGTGFLKTGSAFAAPAIETRRIQNHSWIAYGGAAQEATRRLDFAIKRDGFLAVVGLANVITNVPDLLAHSYNAISVGKPNGLHSRDGTRFDTAGRIKPEIVSPSAFNATSYSVGAVSGAAALLMETADKTAGLENARTNSEVIKAILMAGATKSEFPTWSRTTTQPLDLVYGAGELNIQNSYHILAAGEQAASASSTVGLQGWDFAATAGTNALYFFDVPEGFVLTNFSAMLVWNRNVFDNNPGPTFDPQATLANLDLRLYAATNFALGILLDSSVGTNDNVEHIFQPQLPTGRYALSLTWDLTGHDYAFAWIGTLVPLAGPGLLAVSPAGGLGSSGMVGGPFSPSSIVYTLTNSGGLSLDWAAGKSQSWLSLSATNGSLAAGASTNLTVSINSNANSLLAGSYSDMVGFTNTTSGAGNTTRAIGLSVSLPSLSIGLSNATVIVTWPLAASGYVLQTATNLSAPVDWTDLPPPYATNATEFFISITPVMETFYRLRGP
jgi:hypothetical protein